MAWSGSLTPWPLTLAPCFVNNDYVTAEITYTTAHAHHEVYVTAGTTYSTAHVCHNILTWSWVTSCSMPVWASCESPAATALGLHWSCIMVTFCEVGYGYSMPPLCLSYGCCYCCCVSQERINMSAFPTAYQLFFQPLSFCLAIPGSAYSAKSVNSKKISVTKGNRKTHIYSVQFSSVQSLSHVRLFATPWIAARQACLSITNSWSSLRLAFMESVMPSSHLILGHPLLLLPPIPASNRVFSNESNLCMRWPKYLSFSLSIIPSKESQGWSPSEWTGWISSQSKRLSRVFSNTTVQKHQLFSAQLFL